MNSVGIINGSIIKLNEEVIAIQDRGYQFGDGVYEVTSVYNGRCFALKPHLDRVFAALRDLKIPAVYTMEELARFHEQLIEAADLHAGQIYMQITRGVSAYEYKYPKTILPCLTMLCRLPEPELPGLRETGVRVMTTTDERWARCHIKTLNLLPNVLARQAAYESGCYEAVLIRDGIITEGTRTTFFVVKDDVLWTHPLGNFITPGITRRIVLERLVPQLGLHVVERNLDLDFVAKAEEVFICGTAEEILPVRSINRRQVGDGNPGPITKKLQEAYRKVITEECGT